MNDLIEPVTMEIYHPEKKDFMGEFQRYEPVVLDHTAMIAAKQCLRKYFYQIVIAHVPISEEVYFAWGTAYHKFRQELERLYGYGDNAPSHYQEALALQCFHAAAEKGMNYWKSHAKDQEVTDKFSWMTGARLMKSFFKAFQYWTVEKQKGIVEVLMIEQPFNVELPDGSIRSGTADQIVRWQGDVWGRDFKTTSKDSGFYERTLDPNDQFTGYTYSESKLAGVRVKGQIIELLYNAKSTKKEDKGPEIIPLTASRTEYQLKQWEKEHIFWSQVIAKSREEDIYPMSEVSCSFCPYHGVCGKPNEEGMIYELKQNYKLRPWDHTKVGQD